MDVNLARLRVFLAVADARHFGQAARRLQIAQPSVSQQVARLERQTGTPLFVRDGRSVRLTAAGDELVRLVGPLVRQLDEAVAEFADRHVPRGAVRVGLLSSLASYVLPRAAAAVRSRGIETDLRESSLGALVQGVQDGRLDVGFCYSTADPVVLDGLQVEVLDRRPVTVALPAATAPSGPGPWSWAELDARPWIMPSASRQYREDMLARFERNGVDVDVVAEATTLGSQLALVAAGIGGTFTAPWTPVPDGVRSAPMEGGELLDLLAVHTGGLGVDARAVRDAVSDIVTTEP